MKRPRERSKTYIVRHARGTSGERQNKETRRGTITSATKKTAEQQKKKKVETSIAAQGREVAVKKKKLR